MKRIQILGTVASVLLLAAIVPPLALSGPSGPPAVAAAATPTPPQVWDVGITPALIPWYEGGLARQERWQRRHRFLLRKRWLERKQDLAQARAEAHEHPTYVQPPPPPPTPQAAPATYGYVDPASLPYPWSCVVAVESHGYNVWNSGGSGASGYFQFMPGTWQGLGYSGDAIDYPFSTQYAGAQSLYASQGLNPWAGDGC